MFRRHCIIAYYSGAIALIVESGLHRCKSSEEGQAVAPDVFSAALSEQDEFLVLVSDGIW